MVAELNLLLYADVCKWSQMSFHACRGFVLFLPLFHPGEGQTNRASNGSVVPPVDLPENVGTLFLTYSVTIKAAVHSSSGGIGLFRPWH